MRFVYVLGALFVVLALYVGGYYALVTRELVTEYELVTRPSATPARYKDHHGLLVPVDEIFDEIASTTWQPAYSVDGDWPKTFFQPMHWLDRQVRTDYWEGQRPLRVDPAP